MAYLRRLLAERFSAAELRTLCFDLGIATDHEHSLSMPDLTREAVATLAREGRIPELEAYLHETRPDIQLSAFSDNGADNHPLAGAVAPWMLPASGLLEPAPVWTYALPGQPMAAPVALEGVFLTASQESGHRAPGAVLRALGVASGNVLWERRLQNAVVSGLVRVSPARALLGLSSGGPMASEAVMLAVEANGRLAWQADLDAHHISAPASTGRFACVTADANRLLVLRADTGELVLDQQLPVELSPAAPACGAGVIFVPCRAPAILAVGLDGELAWRFDLEGVLSGVHLDQTPLVTEEHVVVALSSGALLALRRSDGRLLWETQVGPRGKRVTAPTSDGRRVYVGARDGIYALSLASGAHLWVFRTGAHLSAAPVIGGELLCVAGNDRHVYGLDRRTGRLAWKHPLAQEVKTAPLLVDEDPNGPYAVVIDCAGGVTALSYPTAAMAHERAGRWAKAALTWEIEGEPWRAAAAWEAYARWLQARHVGPDQEASAWSAAAQRLASVGADERAASARREAARCLGRPLIALEVRHTGLVLNAWSRLRLVLRNGGFGPARELVVRVAGAQFDGQVAETRKLALLEAGQSQEQELDVKPLEHGDSVPLRVRVTYLDRDGGPHRHDQTIHLPVAREPAARKPGTLQVFSEARLPIGWAEALSSLTAVDLEIRLRHGEPDYEVELTLNGGQVFSGGLLKAGVLDWVPSGDAVTDGRYLFDQLFRDESPRKGWNIARGQADLQGAPRRIRLRIDANASELHQLPWELLHEDDVMLSAAEATPFSRYLPISQPWGRPVADRPLRVLAVIANPPDLADRYHMTPLDVDLERYVLASAFAGIDPRRLRLEFLKPPVTLERLSRAMMEEGYHWLHFVGHGRYNSRQQRLDLLMEDGRGATRAIADHLFCRMLAHRGVQPHLVFLSVCESAAIAGAGDGQILTGLAPRLVQIGVPAVVAMRAPIHLQSAQKLTRAFYASLADDGVVDRALNRARHQLLAAELADAGSPVLFMRLLSGRLWDTD